LSFDTFDILTVADFEQAILYSLPVFGEVLVFADAEISVQSVKGNFFAKLLDKFLVFLAIFPPSAIRKCGDLGDIMHL